MTPRRLLPRGAGSTCDVLETTFVAAFLEERSGFANLRKEPNSRTLLAAMSSSLSSSVATPVDAAPPKPVVGKSGKKICCACPDTKRARDACVVGKGEEFCKKEIAEHNACLRLDGFDVK